MEFPQKRISIKESVYVTLAFFDLFGIPLKKEEIHKYLLFCKSDDTKIDKNLLANKLIQNYKTHYYINANLQEFKKKMERSNEYWKKVNRWRFLFSICPYVKLVAVCNSLAINDTDEESDIDLFIITDKNKIFIARICMIVLTRLFGVKRYGKKIKKRFCLSFFIDESKVNLESIALKPYDIYLAFWIRSMHAVSGDLDTYKSFLISNERFINKYFKNKDEYQNKYFKKRNIIEKFIKNILESLFISKVLNKKIGQWQLRRIFSKKTKLKNKTGTIINSKMLKFHDNDMREKIRKEWEAKLKDII